MDCSSRDVFTRASARRSSAAHASRLRRSLHPSAPVSAMASSNGQLVSERYATGQAMVKGLNALHSRLVGPARGARAIDLRWCAIVAASLVLLLGLSGWPAG